MHRLFGKHALQYAKQTPRAHTLHRLNRQVLMIGHDLYTMNAGDSKAVLCRLGKPIPLTEDHKPGLASEKARIEAAGGQARIAPPPPSRPSSS